VEQAVSQVQQALAGISRTYTASLDETVQVQELIHAAPGHAAGTDFHQGGIAWVGEKGPELVNLPRGTQVMPADKSRAWAAAASLPKIPAFASGTAGPFQTNLNIDGRPIVVNQTLNFSGTGSSDIDLIRQEIDKANKQLVTTLNAGVRGIA
jgi:phage-related tail protein